MASIERSRTNQIEQLQAKALEASFSAAGFDFTGATPGQARATIARAQIALAESKTSRLTTDEQRLASAFATYRAMRRFVKNGTLVRSDDIENLAGALVDAAPLIPPSSALLYLGEGGNRFIRRPVNPAELVGALTTWTDLAPRFGYHGEDTSPLRGQTPRLSLSAVINAARQTGCDLTDVCDEDVALISAAVNIYEFTSEVSRADRSGEIYHTRHRISGAVAIHGVLGSGLNGASAEDYQEPHDLMLPEWDPNREE